MNDPSEKNYADKYIEKRDNIIDNAHSTYISSACSDTKEKDLTLWRLYGNDTKGVCIKFDITKADKLKEYGLYLAPISYGTADNEHFELDVIKNITLAFNSNSWKFEFGKWDIWKHFFKKHLYAIEEEIRLLYMPLKEIPKSLPESKWFNDDRTNIYSELKLFDLRDENFPLTINQIILGTNFPAKEENVKQFKLRLKASQLRTVLGQEHVVVESTIEDYR